MSDEINSSIVLAVNKGDIVINKKKNFKSDLAGADYSDITQTFTTTATALTIAAGVSAAGGIGVFSNLASSGELDIGIVIGGTFNGVIQVLPGETAQCRVATLALYGRCTANTVRGSHLILPP